MRPLIFAVLAAMLAAPVAADEYVNGYFRSDGTYVQPHYRSSPNSTVFDNYSYEGNVNPYTGQRGTSNALRPPSVGTFESPYIRNAPSIPQPLTVPRIAPNRGSSYRW